MKKAVVCFLLMLILTGCSMQTFETVDDGNDITVMAEPATLLIDLPENASALTMQGSSGSLYFCDDYDIAVEILPSGNLDGTLQTLTGFDRQDLELMQTLRCGVDCYEGVWSAAGEAGDCIARFLILDDGCFHYCVSMMTMADNAGACAEEWNVILSSVALAEG